MIGTAITAVVAFFAALIGVTFILCIASIYIYERETELKNKKDRENGKTNNE